jgi:hypothetical protein
LIVDEAREAENEQAVGNHKERASCITSEAAPSAELGCAGYTEDGEKVLALLASSRI